MFYRFAARIRGAGLLAERLSRCAPALSPSNSRKHIGYGNTPITFRRSRPLLVAQYNRGCRCIALACQCSTGGFTRSGLCGFLAHILSEHVREDVPPQERGISSAAPTSQRARPVIPNETNAPEMVLQATGQYSICHSGYFLARFTHYVLVSTSRALSKSVGYKTVGRLLGLKKGSGVSL